MSSFAPGTPQSEIDAFNKKFYGSKRSEVDKSPPQAEPAKGGVKALLNLIGAKKATENLALSDKAKAMADDEKAKHAKELAAQPPKSVAPPVKPQPPRPVAPPVKPQPKTIVDPVRPMPPPIDGKSVPIKSDEGVTYMQPGMAVQAKVPPMPMGALEMSVANGYPSQPKTDKMSMAPVAGDFNPSSFGGGKPPPMGAGYMKKGGKVKASSYKSGGNVSTASSASKRGDGIAQRGKTKGRMC